MYIVISSINTGTGRHSALTTASHEIDNLTPIR